MKTMRVWFSRLFLSHRAAQICKGTPIRRKRLLILKSGFRTSSLSLQEISYKRCLFLVLVAGDAEFLGCGFMTGAGGSQQQRRLSPLAVLRSDFNPDLRCCHLCTVTRLRQCVRFLAYSIVAASPIEWLPSQRKAGHTDIRGKDLHVLDPHVANRNTQVRYVLCLRNAAVVVGLFFLEVSLTNLRPILRRLLARLLQTQSGRVLFRNEINPKGGFKIPCQELIQVLVLCGKSVRRN